jgi:hypothetical protein
MDQVAIPSAIEPNEWFVVFHTKSLSPVLSFLAFGERKHVSAFGYCPGLKVWLLYDVQWGGTRIMLLDKAAIMEWTRGCDVLKIARVNHRMGLSSRIGLYCVSAVKHLIGLVCVAVTPDQLYRHIIRHGGILISEPKQSPAASGRPDAGSGAAAGPD